MISRFKRYFVPATATLLLALPGVGRAQVISIVHDPLNEVKFLVQIRNQVQQIDLMIANLRGYKGGWSDVGGRLVNLQALVQEWSAKRSLSASVAGAQLAQINAEIAQAQRLEALSDAARGSQAIAGAQNRLQLELVTQLQEQRQLTLSQIEQDELAHLHALQTLGAPPYDLTHR